MRGYLVQPKGKGPFPAVLVVHENRGLNPYIEDVARRLATEGFLALAPDALARSAVIRAMTTTEEECRQIRQRQNPHRYGKRCEILRKTPTIEW